MNWTNLWTTHSLVGMSFFASRPGARALGWSSFRAAVCAAPVATLAALLIPHQRGVGFPPELRYAVLTPASWLVAALVAFAYHAFARPRRSLPDRPGPRPRWAVVSVLMLFAVEASALGLALMSERQPPPDSRASLAFEIPRHLFDVDHHFVALPSGARVHYVDEGVGPTLLFLHGNPSWSFQWRELIRGLRHSHRCIALDFAGFGASAAPRDFDFSPAAQSRLLEEFVDVLKLRDLTLVMQDWGGPFGVDFAARRPELVRALVLGSTWAWPTSDSEARGKFSRIVGGPLGEFLQMNFNAFASLGIRNGIVRELPPETLSVYLHPFRSPESRGVAAFYPGQITLANDYFTKLEQQLARLAGKPALIFWAGRDRGFPVADLLRWQRHFPNHRTVELPSADHFFFEDASDVLVAELTTFLGSRTTSR